MKIILFFFIPRQNSSLIINTEKKIKAPIIKQDILKLDNLKITFIVTDLENDTPVSYKGILPDLFREGQGVVAEGKFANGFFLADKIIAKHDENYMPNKNIRKKIIYK